LPDVVDGVLEHGDALRAHAEGKAGPLLGIVAAVVQDTRVYHAGAHDLQPAALLAQAAALAAADDAVHVHFDRRFGKREVAGADAHAPVLAEQAPREGDDRALEVGHADARADRQPLDLLELDLAARGDGLVAVAHAGQDHADRQLLAGRAAERAHGVNLA